jgi:autotransporter-associated beta strand protein
VFAASGTWTQAASGGLWSDTANWSGGIVADGSGFSADFGTIDITADNTVHMDTAYTLTSLIFGDTGTGTAAGWTVDNNGTAGNILTLAGTTPSITVSPLGTGKLVTISAVIDGTTTWSKLGAGTLALNGANTYGGGMTLDAGAINFGNNNAFGTGAITANGGTIKNTAGVTTTNNFVVNSPTTLDVSVGNWILNGNLSGSGAINRGTSANLSFYLGGDNSGYTGTFTAPNNGNAVVRFTSTNAGSAGASWVFNNAIAGRTTLSWSGVGTISFGSMTGSGEIRTDVAGAKTISVGALGLNDTFSGILLNGTGTMGLTKAGSGTMTLSGANTYTGTTTISAGTLTIGGAGQLGGGNYAGAIINNGSLTFSSSAAQTFSGPISGNGNLTMSGSSTLALSGSCSFTGNLTVGTGTLTLASPQSFSPNAVGVSDGATLSETFTPSVQMTASSMTVGLATGATNAFVANSTSLARISAGTLTLNGVNTINIIGGNLVAGSSYPLIAFTTLAGSGSYVLGTLPPGVAGNLSTSANTIYLNVTGVTNTIWTGAVNGTWDINTTANWTNAGTPGNAYINGSPVQFDDTGLNTATISNSVATTLSPISVLVTNNSKNYAFKANTIIGGAASLTKTGTANLTNSTPNTYTGPTAINQGQLVVGVASVANTSGALGNNSAVTLANDPTAVLNLNNFATQIGSLSGGGASGGNVVLGSATLTVGANNTSTTYAGVVGGTGGLSKTGTGALTLSGAHTFTGGWSVNAGTLNYNGSLASGGQLIVNASGASSIVNIGSGANLTFNNTSPLIGNNASGAGALFQSGGTVNRINQLQLGAVTGGSYGYYNLSSGTISMLEFDLGGFNGAAVGVCDISGGVINVTNWFVPSRGTSATGILNMTGGAFKYFGPAGQFLGNWNGGTGSVTVLNIANASLIASNANVNLMQNGQVGKLGEINLLSGGLLQANGIAPGSATGTSMINFNGGTLKAVAANANFLTANNSSVNVYSGSGTIDNNGVNITIPKALSAPSGSGLNGSVTLNSGGSGYIGAPAVTFSGGGGAGAAGYATISGGAVTGVVITSPGVDYSSTPTIVFTGGGGSGASATAPEPTANNSGGMTFQGPGTTTLTGINTYTGATKVLGGTLVINTAVSGPQGGGDLVVSNATLNLDASSGTMSANNISVGSTLNLTVNPYDWAINGTGNMTVGNNTTNNLSYGTVSSAPSAAAIKVAGTLARGTNIVFNVSATGLQPGWIVPLIEADSTAMTTNGFVLGALPAGIKAVLTNSTASTLDLLVTSAGQLLTWYGSEDGVNPAVNWDIATSANWYSLPGYASATYQQYLGNTVGDNVTFGDNAFYTDGTNHVNLTTTVVPATVLFSASSPYELHGAGGIGGATSVMLTNNYAAVYLNTSNSHTGGTIVAGGTLVITNDNALGAPAGGLTLGGGTVQLDAPITNSRAVTVTAGSSIGVVTNVTVQLRGALSGAGGLTKVDNGTLVLAGTNDVQGSLLVRQGTLITLGTNALPAAVRVGDTAGLNGILTVPGGVFNANNNGGQYASSLMAGPASGAYGGIVINGGTLNVAQQLGLGAGAGGYGALNISSGVLNSGSYIVVGFNNDTAVYNQSGGTVTLSSNQMTIAAGGPASIGVANFSGGTFNASLAASSGIIVGERGVGTMNVSGPAIINLTNVAGLSVGPTAAQNGWDGTLNLNGGTVAANRIVKGGGTGAAKVNFNGGTIKAGASSATWLNGFDLATVYARGLTVDDGGFVITIPQALVQATDAGVGSISLSDGGSGYIAPPIVTISGGSGSNATATATVSGGVVTAVVVTSPGTGYSLSDSLSVSFSGGGANVVAPTFSAVNLANNSGGGLTKLGNGTLTLSGASTYTGNTVINAGKLVVTPAHQATNGVFVASGASYGVSLTGAPGTVTNGAITLASGTTALSFGLGTNGNPLAPLIVCGPLTNNGTLSVTLSGSASRMSPGSFPLLKYTGTIQGGGSLNPIIAGPQGSGITLSNSVAHSTLYAVVTSLGGGIVWAGTNASPALTNLWDLNSTVNWLSGGVPTTYQETTPPGDAVAFNDHGSGLVLLSNTVSPASMTISNNSVNYSFQGSGHVSGSMGLTKLGTGSASLAYVGNDFTGPTVISNGMLNLAGGSAIGDSSAVTLANVATAGLTITNGETIGSLAGGGSVVVQGGTLTVGGNGASTTYAGGISGDGSLTKTGNGTLTLNGTNAYTGGTVVSLGTLDYSGQLGIAPATAAGQLIVNNTGTNAIFNVSAPANILFNNNSPMIGNNAAGAGAFYQSGGTISGVNQFQLGAVVGGAYGYYRLSGGSMTMAEMDLAGFNGAAVGVCDISGGTLNITNWFVPSRGNAALGMLNLTGGTLNFSGPAGQFQANWNGGVGTAVINLANASLLAPAANVSMMQTGVAGKLGEINLLAGGLFQANSIAPNSATGNSVLNFNGGTLKASAATATFITANNTAVNVYANGGTIDNNGVNIIIPKALVAPAGDGIKGDITVDNGGSGYIGAPAVTFTGDGIGAAGYAVMSGGSVASIVMTSPGYGYTYAPTVTLTGGGGSGASATAPAPTANTSGGMTFIGTGVTTLSAANTYTGNTVVSNGTLLVNGALAGAVSAAGGATLGGTGTIAGALNNNATFAPGSGGLGTLTVGGSITLNAGSTNTFHVNGSTAAHTTVAAGGAVNYGGLLNIVPGGTFTLGQQFPLFTGAGAVNTSKFDSIAGSPGSGLAFSFTNGVLSVVSGGPVGRATITNQFSGGTLTLTWPAGQGWRLLSQTNELSTGLNPDPGAWGAVPGYADGSYSITADPSNPTVFYRLAYP